jgi:hypothetical protein
LLRRLGGRKIALHGVAVFWAALTYEVLGLRFGRLIVKNNFRARGHKHPHGGSANTARSAGDEGDFGIEGQIHNAYKYRTVGQAPGVRSSVLEIISILAVRPET